MEHETLPKLKAEGLIDSRWYTGSMIYSFDGFNYLVRLDQGERLHEALNKFVDDTDIPGAWLNGLGGVLGMTLGFYDLDEKEYQFQTFEGLYEIASLTGSIAFDEHGKPVFHLHGVFGGREYNSLSGHVKDLTVAATVELFIHRAYQPTKRKANPNVGLATLDL
jgi:hypothetical protein